LLEVLVATSIMAVAVVGLLSALSSSLSNAGRLTDHDKAALAARRKMDELLLATEMLPKMQVLEGPLDPAADGLTGGWRARVSPFEGPPNAGPGTTVLDRVECEIWWMSGDKRRSFSLEGYKQVILR
jgi:type II secretion system protein I